MKKLILLFCLALSGCTGADKAQNALRKGMSSMSSVKNSLTVKAWGLNRALITESREKLVAQAKLRLRDGENPEDILNWINDEIGIDEGYRSEDFAYIMLMNVGAERAFEMMGQADGYIESKKPIWKHFMRPNKERGRDFINEMQSWGPLFKDPKKVMKQSNLR
jgi:hypothetical protein